MAALSSLATRMFGAIDMSAHWRPLQEGDVFRKVDGSHHYVEYVNSSGAYVVPLSSQVREINGHSINFQAGGQTISANAIVQIIHPFELGGNSQEYANYVKLESKSGRKVSGMARSAVPKGAKSTTFDGFTDAPLTETEAEANTATSVPVDEEIQGMAKRSAKKAAAKGNGAANGTGKREKAPKTVRKCVCGCGNETTGHFAPGHDARFHGWIKKLASGKMGPSEIPAAVRKGLDLVQTKDGFKAKAPHYYQEA